MKDVIKEWYITVPWGKLALASWGNPKGQPVLLAHGRQDSLSTFKPLLQYLPDDYYYVALDFPGNGKSDPFPAGLPLSRLIFVLGIDYAIQHLKWKKFVYIAHSLGCGLGLHYNAIYPGRITKMVMLDPLTALSNFFVDDIQGFHTRVYKEYFNNYQKYNGERRLYTKEEAINAVMKARNLTEEQAEIVLERNLIPMGGNKYKLSWSSNLRLLVPYLTTFDFYYELFSKNAPPTLVLNASTGFPMTEHECIDLVKKLEENLPYFFVRTVEGPHDCHITNAFDVAEHVNSFLNRKFIKTKL